MRGLTGIAYLVGGIMLIAGVIGEISFWSYAPYIYTVGAGLFALAQVNSPLEKSNFIVRRLRRQQIFGAILLVLTAVFMFFTHGNEWMVCLTIAAVLELYTAFRIPHELEKMEKDK